MSEQYLHRGDAPFGARVWEAIDNAVVAAAKSRLGGRRLLTVEGPFGLGLKSVSNRDQVVPGKNPDGVGVAVSTSLPVVMIRKNFTLGVRDIAAFEQGGLVLDLADAVEAALACAGQEDQLVFSGAKGLFPGLLEAPGVKVQKLRKWNEVGNAVEDLIQAVSALDAAGFHGPYALALSPELYNGLFRRYPQSDTMEIEHLKKLVTDGIFKVSGIAGGVLTVRGRQYGSIMLGQDLMTGFVGPDGEGYEFSVSESFTLRLATPGAFCVLQPGR